MLEQGLSDREYKNDSTIDSIINIQLDNMHETFVVKFPLSVCIKNPGTEGNEWPLYILDSNYVTLDTAHLEVRKSLRSTQCIFWNYLKFLSDL